MAKIHTHTLDTRQKFYVNGVTQSLTDTLYPDKAATEAALGRTDPGSAGIEGQALQQGPGGPRYTDDAVSLDWYSDPNAAIAAAKSRGIRARGQGSYVITDTVQIDHDCDLTLATFTINDADATAVRVGATSALTSNITVHLPTIVQAAKASVSSGWSGVSVGLELRNIERSRIYVNEIKHFTTGIYMTANGGRGTVNNEIFLAWLNNNKVHIHIQPADTTSWCNEATWFDGLYYHSSLETPSTSGSRKILIGSATQTVNSHRFVGATIGNGSADDVAEYLVECYGADNLWLGCRWESTNKNVWWQSDASGSAVRNRIMGGLGAEGITFTESGNARYNRVDTDARMVIDGLTSASTPATLQVANWTSQLNPAIAVVQAAAGILNRAATAYGWGVSLQRSYFKGVADAKERLRIQHTTGEMSWGAGIVDPDTSLARKAANVLGTGSDDGFRAGTFTTAGRPTAASMGAGTQVFDTTLNKPIWSDGTNWRDAAGTIV